MHGASPRTKAALEALDLAVPIHRSRQADEAALGQAVLVIALAPEHVQWVRRRHPEAAARSGRLRRLGGGDADVFATCAAEVAYLIAQLPPRLLSR